MSHLNRELRHCDIGEHTHRAALNVLHIQQGVAISLMVKLPARQGIAAAGER